MAFLGPALFKLVEHLKALDGDTVTLLTRFTMRGVKSGNLNGYVKNHLQSILDGEDDAEEAASNPPGPAPKVSTRPIRP